MTVKDITDHDYDVFVIMDDLYEPTDEDLAEHWNGEGCIVFYVIQNTSDVFEIEVIDWSGCAGGLQDTLGIEYYITNCWCLQEDEVLKEGVTYTLDKLTVQWFKGDGWEIDDDVEYDFEEIYETPTRWKLATRIRQKLSNWWWRSIGWRIANHVQKDRRP